MRKYPVAILVAMATGVASGADAPNSEAATPETIEETTIVAAPPDSIEEVIVRGTRPESGRVVMLPDALEIYDARRRGTDLYRRGEYAAAFPHLLVAARRGFKFAQARVGFLYQQGLGTDRDGWEAMAWLGLASRGTTMPEIRNYFNALWEKVPEGYRPQLLDKIDIYEEQYGTRINRVACDRGRKVGTYMPTLTCRFIDDHLYQTTNQDLQELSTIEIPTVGS
ncbi:MAG: hypothetical protein OXK76_16535 [Gammaproteobacteria bacterium]|nr:hypothetical protein [Gammaproteobacteria bacterium]